MLGLYCSAQAANKWSRGFSAGVGVSTSVRPVEEQSIPQACIKGLNPVQTLSKSVLSTCTSMFLSFYIPSDTLRDLGIR